MQCLRLPGAPSKALGVSTARAGLMRSRAHVLGRQSLLREAKQQQNSWRSLCSFGPSTLSPSSSPSSLFSSPFSTSSSSPLYTSASPLNFPLRYQNALGDENFRIFFADQESGEELSPWHDLPLHAAGSTPSAPLFTYVNEIAKGTTAKMEISTKEKGNPIKQVESR